MKILLLYYTLWHKVKSVVADDIFLSINFAAQSMKANNHIRTIDPSGISPNEITILETLQAEARRRSLWTWQPWTPHPQVSKEIEGMGILHHPDDLRSTSTIVIPPHGAPMSVKKIWKTEGKIVIDHSSPAVRRAQSALSLMRLEGSALAIIGRRQDPESLALIADHPSARVVENAEDAVRMPFAPSFGIVCQTAFDPSLARRFSDIIQGRHRDSRVTFLDTHDPEEELRRKALRKAAPDLDAVIVLGYSLSADMLVHTARELRLVIYKNCLPPQPIRRLAIVGAADVPQQEIKSFVENLSLRSA